MWKTPVYYRPLKVITPGLWLIFFSLSLSLPAQSSLYFSAKLKLNDGGVTQEVSQDTYNFGGKTVEQTNGTFTLFPKKQYQFDLTFNYQNFQDPKSEVTESDFRNKRWQVRTITSKDGLHQDAKVINTGSGITVSTFISGPQNKSGDLLLDLLNEKGQQVTRLRFPYFIQSPTASQNTTSSLIIRPNFKLYLIIDEPKTGRRLVKKELVWALQNPPVIDLKMDADLRLIAVIEESIIADKTTHKIQAGPSRDYGYKAKFYWERKYAAVGTRPKMSPINMMAYLDSMSPEKTNSPSRSGNKETLRQRRQQQVVRERQGRAVTGANRKPATTRRSAKTTHKLAIEVSRDNAVSDPFTYYVNLRIVK